MEYAAGHVAAERKLPFEAQQPVMMVPPLLVSSLRSDGLARERHARDVLLRIGFEGIPIVAALKVESAAAINQLHENPMYR